MSFDGTTIEQALARDESRQNLDGVPLLSVHGSDAMREWLKTATDEQKRAVISDLNKQLGIKPLVRNPTQKPRTCTPISVLFPFDMPRVGVRSEYSTSIPVRCINALESAGVSSVEDLEEYTLGRLLGIRNIGVTMATFIADAMKRNGTPLTISGRRRCTDAEIQAWADRHDLNSGMGIGNLREVFEDAASVHMTKPGETVTRDFR